MRKSLAAQKQRIKNIRNIIHPIYIGLASACSEVRTGNAYQYSVGLSVYHFSLKLDQQYT